MSETTLPSILLCEDDPNLGRLLSDYLKAKGFETTWAKDGVEGLKEFHRGAFDFVILDVMMPRKDGFQVAEEIRQESRHLPILYLTARSTNEDTLEGFKVGAGFRGSGLLGLGPLNRWRKRISCLPNRIARYRERLP